MVTKIYIQDNFIPDVNVDQFRRKVIGVEVTLNSGQTFETATKEAEKYITDYIKKNTVERSEDMSGTIVRDITPAITKSPKELIIDEILACTKLEKPDGLYSFTTLAQKDAEIKAVYDLQLLKIKNK